MQTLTQTTEAPAVRTSSGQPHEGTVFSDAFKRKKTEPQGHVVDKHYRSLIKAISWRITGTMDTILVSFLITGKIKLALSIGVVEVGTKIVLFYVHERLWNKIRFGRVKVQEDYTI